MIYNPSYELAVNIGVPDGNYVDHDRTAAVDVGATFFADSRLAVEGLHSLRLCNPSNDSAGLLLAPYTLGNSAQHPEAGTEFLPLTLLLTYLLTYNLACVLILPNACAAEQGPTSILSGQREQPVGRSCLSHLVYGRAVCTSRSCARPAGPSTASR
jgi:hypothetical protein